MVSDHLSDTSEYGTTYISDKKIAQLMGDLHLSFETKRKAFGNLQDLIIAQKK
jgi:nucleoid-associated protein YejK